MFWFCVWMFCFMFFPFLVDHTVLLFCLILLESFKTSIRLVLLPSFLSVSLSLVCICALGSRKSKDFASVHLSEDFCALQRFLVRPLQAFVGGY